MKFIFSIFVVFLLFSCKKEEKKGFDNFSKNIVTETEDCKCYYADGSETPPKIITFSNKKSVSLCGYIENDEYSEFTIQKTDTKLRISEYFLYRFCRLKFVNDSLEIIAMENLPSEDNWKWKNVDVSREIIYLKNGEIETSGKIVLPIKSNISQKNQESFLKALDGKKALNEEEIIWRLYYLAISGNEKAEEKLKNLKKEVKYNLDGHNLEQYDEAIEKMEEREKPKYPQFEIE